MRSSARPEADLLAVPRAFRTIARGPGGEDPADWDLDQVRTHNIANEIDTNNVHSDGPDDNAITQGGGQTAWISPKCDACGNLIIGPKPCAEATAAEGLLMVYDAWNRLVEVWKDNGGATPDKQLVKTGDNKDTLLVKYRYDGLNRRVAKVIPNGETNWDRTDYYYNTSWQVLEERAQTVASETAVATAVKVQYVWDIRYIDAPVLRWRDTGGDPDLDETLYYCNDANMNVTALVNTDGAVVERYMYDPYGKPTFYNGSWTPTQLDEEPPGTLSVFANEILFAGYRYDPETSLYHVRHRQYHPTLGRWLQRDPIGYADGLSLYEYVRSSPCGWRDPSGESLMLDSRGPCAPWFAHFAEIGCCDCAREDVEPVIWRFAIASADMMERAHSGVISWTEALEWVRAGEVANAGGTRTDLYAACPTCVKQLVDDYEGSWAMFAATLFGYGYHTLVTYGSTGELSFGNGWLAMEAKRSEHMVRGMTARLNECERLKQEHANWQRCCGCAGEGLYGS